MTRKISNPVESVVLRVSIRADGATGRRIKELIPSAKVRNGGCEIKVTGERPAEVAARAEEMMQKLRGVVALPKDFKNAERSIAQK